MRPLSISLQYSQPLLGSRGPTRMSILIIDIEKNIEESFRQIVEKRFGHGEQTLEIVLNALMKDWVEKQGIRQT